MAETDLSTWLSIADAAQAIGCSKRTVERLGKARSLEQRLRRQEGTPPVAVYNPDDVQRIASERQRTPAPFVLPAVGNGNGNGHGLTYPNRAGVVDSDKLTARATDDPIRQLCAALVSWIQSPPRGGDGGERGGERLFLTIAEASLATGLTQAYLRRACESGSLKAIRDRGWRIRRKDLEQL